MGFWLTFFMWIASFLLTDYFRAKLPNQEPSGEGDFQSPTSTEGRKIPQVVGGTVKVKGPNTLWRGNWEAVPVTVTTGVVFKRDETVGYQYNIAIALGQFIGPTAGMTAIYIGDDKVWDYVADNSGVPADVADVDLPELYGGETKGGGFVGRFRAFKGTDGNPLSSFLNFQVPNQSAWPGLTWVMITNLTETAGANIGEANQLRDIRVEWQTFDTIANGGLGNELGLAGNTHFIGRDANPISAAYKVLTDTDWGITLGDINFSNFQAAAQVCYDEGIGYSQLVDSEIEAFEILAEIEKHIDGYIGPNPNNGLMEVTLARAGYVLADQFQATEDNIKAINNYAKPEWPQTKNEVKVRFVNREKDYSDDHAVAQDMAGRLIAGRPQSVTIRFPGLRDAAAANSIVARTARAYFWPLSKFQLELDRSAWDVRPGSVVVVTHPDIAAVDLPTRVTKISTGDPVKQTIKAEVVEDVFATEAGIQAQPQPTEDVPPVFNPVTITTEEVTYAPRWLLELNEQLLEPRLLFLVGRNNPNTGWQVRYRYRDAPFGGNFAGPFQGESIPYFTRVGTLRADLSHVKATANTGAASVANGGGFQVDGDLQSLTGSYLPARYEGLAIINPRGANEEFVAIGAIVVDGAGVECSGVWRGIGNSPILEHTAGETVWFIDKGAYLQPWVKDPDLSFGYQYALTPIAQGVLGTDQGLQGEIAVDDRGYEKPYPPTGVIFTNVNSTVWFADGNVEASGPGASITNPSSGIPMTVFNRRFDQQNAVYGASSLEDDAGVYPNNSFTDVDPQLRWWIYDLDTHPTPVRANAILSGTVDSDDRTGVISITKEQVEALASTNASPINARFEYVWANQITLDEVLAGTESNSTFVDKVIEYLPPQDSLAAFNATVLLLHFEGFDGTTQVIDYSDFDHPVTLAGDAVIDTDIPPDTGLQPGSMIMDDVGDWANIPDDPSFNLSPVDGFTLQARVYIKEALSGEIPIISKWETAGNQRSFWFGFFGGDLRIKMSTDGTNEIIEDTGNRTWTIGQWYEITVVVTNISGTNTHCLFFVDGAFDETETATTISTPLFDSTAPVRIGADGDGNSGTTFNIDEVRIANESLYFAPFTLLQGEYPGRERKKVLHCNWENANDLDRAYVTDDLNRMTVTWPTGVNVVTEIQAAQSKFGTQSLFCNGRNASDANDTDGVWLADTGSLDTLANRWDFGVGDLTFECWVRFDALPSSNANGMALISKYHRGLGSHWGNQFFEFTGANQLQFAWSQPNNNGTTLATTVAPTIVLGTWYHVAFVRKDGESALLFDGNRVAFSSTLFANYNMSNSAQADVAIGRRRSTSSGTVRHRAMNGWMDEVRVINGEAVYDPTQTTYTVPTAAFPVDPLPEVEPVVPSPANKSSWQPTNQ